MAGTLLRDTLALLARNWLPAMCWWLALVAAGAAVDLLLFNPAAGAYPGLVAAFAQFLLTGAALRRMGAHHAWGEPGRAAPFIGVSLVSTIAIAAGLLCLILPGLFLYARWSVAMQLVIGEGMSTGMAIGTSWRRTASRQWPILAAFTVTLGVAGAGLIAFAFYPPYGPLSPSLAIIANGLLYSGMVVSWHLAVATHLRLTPATA